MQAKTDAALAKKSKPSKAKPAAAAAAVPMEDGGDTFDVPMEMMDGGGGGGNKRLSVERIYQKKTQLEHILLRPDTYIGSVETVTQVKR